MRCLQLIVVTFGLAGALQAAADTQFLVVDVFVESAAPLAAWQVAFRDRAGRTRVVGIEAGADEAFERPPYYDREAVNGGQADRIVLANYSLAAPQALPRGRVRVARLHVMVDGAADFSVDLDVAATAGGQQINAIASVQVAGGQEQ